MDYALVYIKKLLGSNLCRLLLLRLGIVGSICLFTLHSFIPVQALQYTSSIYELRYHQAFQTLRTANSDVIGWLTIPGTKIDFPLLQGTDNNYYLKHSPNQTKDAKGSIFLDYRNQADFQNENTIVYGHNFNDDKTMFGSLLAYEDQLFYESHPYLIVSLANEIRYYKIFASYTTHTNFYYIQTTFDEDASVAMLMNEIQRRNQLNPRLSYQMDDRLLTLSTCSFRFENARFVVHAVLLDVREVVSS